MKRASFMARILAALDISAGEFARRIGISELEILVLARKPRSELPLTGEAEIWRRTFAYVNDRIAGLVVVREELLRKASLERTKAQNRRDYEKS